ncbi:hypothetical protein EDD29_1761 [Actinocorallia herbida]|uniref:Uncharacterized protein n=1 Tax=Actinocorallia herbida TaxID=58109 RepID=A0A3N1CSE4_9ACTN|nr:hypothetical protein [Actinocorallia herbida]ROO84241.1 hypothetical protein EDD29_1761 [Actinocorallia herbida]
MPDAPTARRAAPGDMGLPRRAALEHLATLLRRRGFTVRTAHWHLTAALDEGAPVEVWCHTRPEDSGRLWFTHPGGTPISPADAPGATALEVHRRATAP